MVGPFQIGTNQILGSIALVLIGIVFRVLHEMPFKMPLRRRVDRLWRKISWVLPYSGKPPRHGLFYFLFGIPFGLFVLGVEMTGNCTVAGWAFIATEISAVITVWISLVVLKHFARYFWTGVIALVLGTSLFYLDEYLCPVVTINPKHTTLDLISTDPNGFSETRSFRIQNKGDDDVYAISFEVIIESTALSFKDFRFDVPKSSWVPMDENTPIGQKFGDIVGMDCTDSINRVVFWRSIAHLRPRGELYDSREVTLTLINPIAESSPFNGKMPDMVSLPAPNGDIAVRAKILSFSLDSHAFKQPNTSGAPAGYMPALKCGSMAVLVIK